jgi:hypothetical protein
MDKIDLKKMWSDAHNTIQENIYDELNFRKTLKMTHSKIISKVLSDLKLKIFGYSMILIILISLMIYALGYLGLHLSANTLILFSFIGLFFFIRTTLEVNRLLVLTKTSNNLSVKESVLFFRKKLKRRKIIDFLSYLIYFYTLGIWSIYSYIKDIGGVKNLFWGNAFQVLLLIAFLILLSIPWLIKYQHNKSYKKLYSNLKESAGILNDENGVISE